MDDLSPEHVLGCRTPRELYGDAVDDPKQLRRAWSRLARTLRDGSAEVMQHARELFERARDRPGATDDSGGTDGSLAARVTTPIPFIPNGGGGPPPSASVVPLVVQRWNSGDMLGIAQVFRDDPGSVGLHLDVVRVVSRLLADPSLLLEPPVLDAMAREVAELHDIHPGTWMQLCRRLARYRAVSAELRRADVPQRLRTAARQALVGSAQQFAEAMLAWQTEPDSFDLSLANPFPSCMGAVLARMELIAGTTTCPDVEWHELEAAYKLSARISPTMVWGALGALTTVLLCMAVTFGAVRWLEPDFPEGAFMILFLMVAAGPGVFFHSRYVATRVARVREDASRLVSMAREHGLLPRELVTLMQRFVLQAHPRDGHRHVYHDILIAFESAPDAMLQVWGPALAERVGKTPREAR